MTTNEEYVGKTYNNLEIIDIALRLNMTTNKNETWALCKCLICQNSFEGLLSSIKKGSIRSCCRLCTYLKKIQDKELWQVYGDAKVIDVYYEYAAEQRQALAFATLECQVCGEKFNRRIDSMKVGNSQACSRTCVAISKAKRSIGKVYDELRIVNVYQRFYRGYNESIAIVECVRCGYQSKKALSLVQSEKRIAVCSNCTGSYNERVILDYLRSLGVTFVNNKATLQGNTFRPDFTIYASNSDLTSNNIATLIEYDGIQHTQPVTFGGTAISAKISFENTILNDQLQNKYCADNSIPYLRINYDLDEEKYKRQIFFFLKDNKLISD